MTAPTSRRERAVMDALGAAIWSSDASDVVLSRVRPTDLVGADAIVLAAVADLRATGARWTDPGPVMANLADHADWWREYHRNPPGALPPVPADRQGPERWLLQAAALPLQSGRAAALICHDPALTADAAAREVAAARRREVSGTVMREIHQLVTDPPPGTTRAERAEATGVTLRRYRDALRAEHLYPPREPGRGPASRPTPGLGR